jgi:hypothetical protein
MRKRLISPIRSTGAVLERSWLELDRAAVVEVTSEAAAYPVEGALLNEGERGWRAATPGVQTVRLLFDKPQTIRRIRLVFKEQEFARTQEFVLRWSRTAEARGKTSCANNGTSVRPLRWMSVRITVLNSLPLLPSN